MAEKDIKSKILMSYADVFADCINTLVYGGRQRLNEENTHRAPTESFYKGKGEQNQFCDVGRYLIEESSILVEYIIENELRPKERQVIRKISYQGGAYRQQLESGERVYPVICIVLAWTGKTNRIPLSLHQLLEKNGALSEDIEYVDDAKLMIYRMNNLSEEVRERFVSDVGFVADYLNEGSFDRRKGQRIVHMEALCDMMEALTGDKRFTEMAEKFVERQQKGDVIIMCEYIDALEARGEAKGEKKGEARLAALLEKLYDLGRREEAEQAVRNPDVRTRLYKEFCII